MEARAAIDPRERADLLLRDLRGSRSGLTLREAQRRFDQCGPDEIHRRDGASHLRPLPSRHPPAGAALVGRGGARTGGTRDGHADRQERDAGSKCDASASSSGLRDRGWRTSPRGCCPEALALRGDVKVLGPVADDERRVRYPDGVSRRCRRRLPNISSDSGRWFGPPRAHELRAAHDHRVAAAPRRRRRCTTCPQLGRIAALSARTSRGEPVAAAGQPGRPADRSIACRRRRC